MATSFQALLAKAPIPTFSLWISRGAARSANYTSHLEPSSGTRPFEKTIACLSQATCDRGEEQGGTEFIPRSTHFFVSSVFTLLVQSMRALRKALATLPLPPRLKLSERTLELSRHINPSRAK